MNRRFENASQAWTSSGLEIKHSTAELPVKPSAIITACCSGKAQTECRVLPKHQAHDANGDEAPPAVPQWNILRVWSAMFSQHLLDILKSLTGVSSVRR
jgi:hypothetical protein